MASDGEAGRSAREQYEQRVAASRAKRVDFFGPKLGKFLNFLIGDSKSAAAWKKGAAGEAAAGEFLNKFADENGFYVLHDRAIPGSRANIDHILVSDRGVFVIDAKNYKGMIRIKENGSLLKSKETLYIGSRDQTRLVEGVKKQVYYVSRILNDQGLTIPVTGVLAFVEAEFPLLFKPRTIDGVLINGKGIEAGINSLKLVSGIDVNMISDLLMVEFPVKR